MIDKLIKQFEEEFWHDSLEHVERGISLCSKCITGKTEQLNFLKTALEKVRDEARKEGQQSMLLEEKEIPDKPKAEDIEVWCSCGDRMEPTGNTKWNYLGKELECLGCDVRVYMNNHLTQ